MKSRAYVTAYNRIRKAIKRAYRQLRREGGWRAVGARFKITGGMAFRIGVDGYEPSDPAICQVLGLPVTVEVELDPKSGRLHVPEDIKVLRIRKAHKRLDEMSEDEIRAAFEHRQVSTDQQE